jgi:hypothetical protein
VRAWNGCCRPPFTLLSSNFEAVVIVGQSVDKPTQASCLGKKRVSNIEQEISNDEGDFRFGGADVNVRKKFALVYPSLQAKIVISLRYSSIP